MAGTPVAGDPPPLLRNGGFYRLLSVRLVGSFSDGLLQAGLATFILFSPERQPTPLAIAVAFAILLLPYSLISPFAGVFLDRWRRRQVLLYANWARALVVLGVAGLVFAERDGIDLGITVLVALGIGRFVLAGLSASLPHLVPPEQLVPANSISPTAGSIIFGVGAVAGIGLRGALGGGDSGAALLLCLAAAVYVAAGTLALTLRAGQLGPDGDRPADTVAGIVIGLIDGFRSLLGDRPSWRVVVVVLVYRLGFGVLTVVLLLILRHTLHPESDPDAALADFATVAVAVTAGALCAALITTAIVRRTGARLWTTATMVVAGVVTPVALAQLSLVAMLVGGFLIGLAQQAAKIGADSTLQARIDDDHLGRVFSLFDVGINVALVIGAILVAFTVPADGVSMLGFVLLGLLYLATAAWYWFGERRKPAPAAHRTAP